MKKHFLIGITTLMGAIVGAGILAMPYSIAKSGFLIGGLEIILLGFIVTMFYLYFGEVCLRTKGTHELVGYAERYLGKKGKILMTFGMFCGINGALIAYILGEGQAFSAIFGGNSFFYSLGFFIIFSIFVFMGLKLIKNIELYLMMFTILVVYVLSGFSFGNLNLNNLTTINLANMFLPYGIILFAFSGLSVIPEVKEELRKNRKIMKKVIICGLSIVLITYFLFSLFVVGVTGESTSEVATIGLGNLIGGKVLLLGNLFAILAMSTSFLTLGLALRWMYQYDYKLNKNLAVVLTCLIPFIIFLSGISGFVKTIGLAGIFGGGLEGVLILFMHYKAKKSGDRKPEYTIKGNKITYTVLLVVFLTGVIAYLLSYFNIL